MRAEPNEVEALHVAFRRAAELLAAGNGAWKVTPNALKAMRDAVSKFQRLSVPSAAGPTPGGAA